MGVLISGVAVWWVVGIGLFSILLYPFFRNSTKRTQNSMQANSRQSRSKGRSLSEDEQKEMSNEIRQLVSTEYDLGYSTAKNAGKDEYFARHIGTYRVINYYILRSSANVSEEYINEECMPFFKLDPDTAKSSISEYVVWKFFPNESVHHVLQSVLQSYKDFLFSEAGKLEEKLADKFLFDAIYCEKHDWQRYIAALPSETK